jgi:hypothetical protein
MTENMPREFSRLMESQPFTIGIIFPFVNKNNQVMGLLFLQNKDIPQTRFNLVCGINTRL